MRLSELTNEMLSTYKYPNLMAEVKESTILSVRLLNI